jgi:hypothetical protein
MFRVSFQHRQYYYLTQENMQAMYPSPLNRAWKDRVLDSAANVLSIPCTRARPHNVDTVTILRSSVNETDIREENEPQSNNNVKEWRLLLLYAPTGLQVMRHTSF